MPTIGRGPVTLAELSAGLIWPRLFRALPIAAHPTRLMIATVSVVIFMGLGVSFDWLRGPIAPPRGLDAPLPAPAQREAVLVTILGDEALVSPDIAAPLLASPTVDPAPVREAVRRSLVLRLESIDSGADGYADDFAEQRRLALAALERVDAVAPRGLFRATVSEVVGGVNRMVRGVVTLDLDLAAAGAGVAFIETPRALVTRYPLSGAALLLLAIVVFSLGGAALCRGAACEMAGDVSPTATASLAFALPRWVRSAAPLLIILAVIAFLALGLAVGGAALLRLPVLDVVGGLLWGLFLVAGLVLAALSIGAALASPLFVPAIAVESTDAVDAAQRAYAYMLGAPGRLILYAATLLLQGAVAYAIVAWIVAMAMNWTGALAGAWAGDASPVMGEVSALRFALPERELGLSGSAAVAAGLVGLWDRIAMAALAGFVLSFFFSASTVLYLLLRRINDGQDVEEIWTPGMIEGTMAPLAPQRRAPNERSSNGDDDQGAA